MNVTLLFDGYQLRQFLLNYSFRSLEPLNLLQSSLISLLETFVTKQLTRKESKEF